MSDVRALLAAALESASHQIIGGVAPNHNSVGGHLSDALLSLPGIAIVKLPEPTEEGPLCFQGGGYGVAADCVGTRGNFIRAGIGPYLQPPAARAVAAALLAAAEAAEGLPA